MDDIKTAYTTCIIIYLPNRKSIYLACRIDKKIIYPER